jgi:hypothetical protein
MRIISWARRLSRRSYSPSLLAEVDAAGQRVRRAFSPPVSDGTGQLGRACVQGTAAKVCTAAW